MDGQKDKERNNKMKLRKVTEEMMMEQDGKRVGGDSDHWIYLTNLKAYNEGFLLGVYLHFPFDEEEYDFSQSLAKRYDSLEEYMSYPDEVIRVIAENRDAEINIIELYDAGVSNHEKLRYALVSLRYYDILEHLANYVDYEAIGRDYRVRTSGEFVSSYYIDTE